MSPGPSSPDLSHERGARLRGRPRKCHEMSCSVMRPAAALLFHLPVFASSPVLPYRLFRRPFFRAAHLFFAPVLRAPRARGLPDSHMSGGPGSRHARHSMQGSRFPSPRLRGEAGRGASGRAVRQGLARSGGASAGLRPPLASPASGGGGSCPRLVPSRATRSQVKLRNISDFLNNLYPPHGHCRPVWILRTGCISRTQPGMMKRGVKA